MIEITNEALDPAAVTARVARDSNGAVIGTNTFFE